MDKINNFSKTYFRICKIVALCSVLLKNSNVNTIILIKNLKI